MLKKSHLTEIWASVMTARKTENLRRLRMNRVILVRKVDPLIGTLESVPF